MQKPAKHLFKFNGPTAYALQNLRSGMIYCQHYTAYNDPFEYWTRIFEGIPDPEWEPERFLAAVRAWGFDVRTIAQAKAEPLIWDNFRAYFGECQHYVPPFEVMRQGMRIACFGSEQNDLLMWSHYGDGLRGFCIVFDENLIADVEPKGYLLDVAYLEAPPKVDSFVYGIAWDQDWYSQTAIDETNVAIKYQGKMGLREELQMYEEAGANALRTMRDIWQQVFATKPTEWSYERERRLLVQTEKTDDTPVFRRYPHEAVKEVILGERMPEAYRSEVLAVLKTSYAGVRVKTAHRAQGIYTLIID
ncbi:DUF2971 domain-containing protein [Microvirga yunnanensis]|uniref:DUF2971 domain-containing protein n=1 Tax=Microvirga yunnanensis TaxID=2953740 RepID=UPI0021C8A6A0|nr:DUF2971 domain-containing protein [Microvirga sp. HBU65207]